MPSVSISVDSLRIQIAELKRAADEIQCTRKAIIVQYQQLGCQWNDGKYKMLGGIVRESSASLRNIENIFHQSQKVLVQLLSAVDEYEGVNLFGGNHFQTVDEEYVRSLSSSDVNERWQSGIHSINEQIANYKEALMACGVPECKWLNQTLAKHKAAMLEQEGYDLDVASGHVDDTVNNSNAYHYPEDYAAFYTQLAATFNQYCMDGTNPNYLQAPAWQNNCQRCVPAYELRRRGNQITTRPSTYGSSHLLYRPFDVWEGADIQNSAGSGMSSIQDLMASWGDGARAQIVVSWDSPLGGGHTFLAEQRNGTTVFFDPQTGNSNCSGYFDRVIDGGTQFCRIDNLQFSPYIEDCYMEVA